LPQNRLFDSGADFEVGFSWQVFTWVGSFIRRWPVSNLQS
jgi:hypothetical protein